MARPVNPSQSYSSSESAAVMAIAAFVDPLSAITRKAVSGPLASVQQQQQQQRLCASGPLFPEARLAVSSYDHAANQQTQQLQHLAGPASSFATTPLAELWWGVAPSADAMAVADAVWGAHAAQHQATLAPHPASPSFAPPSNAPVEGTVAGAGCWEWAEAGAMAAVEDEEEVSSTYRGDDSCPNTPGCNGDYPAAFAAAIASGYDCGIVSPTALPPVAGFHDGAVTIAKCVCGGDGYSSARCLCAMGVPHLAVPQGFDVEGWTTSCDSDMDDDVASVEGDEEGSWGESECGPCGEASPGGGDSWWLGSSTDCGSSACGGGSCAVAC
ncbi:hypothetical protein CLOM_g23828 [Closterium sp. NIES-68]|nr:hypothetical protein CLOM_g23828 [Closterium sp. NIES-68]GJP81533.1 hypothetical protein CLOP_g11675 [Closterium sp. NIES-67]